MNHHEKHAATYRWDRVRPWLTAALWVFCMVVAVSLILGAVVDLVNGDLTTGDAVWAVIMVLVLAVAGWSAPKLVRQLRAAKQ